MKELGKDRYYMVKIISHIVLLLFTFLLFSLSFSFHFVSFFGLVFFFSSFHICFSFYSSLLFVYCNFFEKKKITFEDLHKTRI